MAGLPGGLAALVHPQAALLGAAQLRPAVATNPAVAAAAAAQQQQLRAADASMAKKLTGRKRKAQDKAAGEKAVNLVPESALFNSLVMQERQLDNSIRRRRLELQQAAHPYEHPVQKRLRVYVYVTHSHQQQAASTHASASQPAEQKLSAPSSGVLYAKATHQQHTQEPPSWTLVVWGRLVDINDPPPEPGSATAAAIAAASQQQQQQQQQLPAQHKHQPFTSFFKRITIQLDAGQYPGKEGSVAWDKLQHRGSHKDRLEVKRLGSSNVDVQVTLEQDASPPLYKLHSGLAELLGVRVDHQMSVLSRTWAYIHKQQEQADPQVLHLDDKLSELMGTQELPRIRLPEAIGKLLKPLEPLTFSHTIDVSGPSPGSVTCLDLDVVLPAKLADKVAPGVDALLEEKGLEGIEQKLSTQLAKLFEARRRRAFLLGFAEAPVAFMNGVIASQARELRAARTGPKDVELERRTDVFFEKWVEEAAAKYLAKRNGHPGL